MRTRGLDEEAAYRALRTLAMEQGRRLIDIANGVIAVGSLLGSRQIKAKK
jgi:AmiR/NasT family two-component response regulator